MKELKISTSKSKRQTYAFTFGSLTLIYLVLMYFKFITMEFGTVLCCLTGGLTLYFIYTIYNPKVAITINEEGLRRNVFKGKNFITWEEMQDVYICIVKAKKYDEFYLGIKLNEEEGNTKKVKFKGKLQGNRGDLVMISIDDYDTKPYDIYNNMQKFYKGLKK